MYECVIAWRVWATKPLDIEMSNFKHSYASHARSNL